MEKGSFRDFVPLRGAIVPRDTIDIDAVSGGQVKRVLVEPGDMVTAGQPLVEFANTGLQLTVIQQEGGTNQSIAQLQQNEIALEENKIANDRALAQIDYNIVRLTPLAAAARRPGGQGICLAGGKRHCPGRVGLRPEAPPNAGRE